MSGPTTPRKKAWHTIPIEIQLKVLFELKTGIKTQEQICTENDLSKTNVQKIKRNKETIKLIANKREGKWEVNMDEPPPTLLPQTPLPEQNSLNECRKKARGRPRRSSASNFATTSTPGTSMSMKMANQSLVFPSPPPNLTQAISTTKVNQSKNFNFNSTGQTRKYSKSKNVKNLEVSTSIEYDEESLPQTPLRGSGKTADWDEFLSDGNNLFFIPPVTAFKHAPLSKIWKEFAVVGRVFEVANPFVRCSRPVNWLASVVHFTGYKALIEFECLGLTPKFMAWMSYCSDIPKPIGYSDKHKIVLHPPHEVRAEYPDFLARGREALLNSSRVTILDDHGEYVLQEIKKCQKYALNTKLEVMDKTKISRMRIATVTALVGDRIHVSYVIEPRPNDTGFWFNVNSDLVHPVGWSQTVEHEIYGVPKSAKFTPLGLDYFPKYQDDVKLARGQLLEVRHPVQPNIMCAAVVYRLLKHGYFVVEIKVLPEEVKLPTKFTYHITSPYVVYCGFCEKHGVKISPPYGESPESFSWDDYIRRLNLTKASIDLLPKRPAHQFKPGMKLEGIDITQPSYLGPCTILKCAGHLLYIHYDGWKRESPTDRAEAWIDAESSDIYPIGYAEMVGHEFQGCVEPVHPNDIIHYKQNEEGVQDIEETDCDDNSTISTIISKD